MQFDIGIRVKSTTSQSPPHDGEWGWLSPLHTGLRWLGWCEDVPGSVPFQLKGPSRAPLGRVKGGCGGRAAGFARAAGNNSSLAKALCNNPLGTGRYGDSAYRKGFGLPVAGEHQSAGEQPHLCFYLEVLEISENASFMCSLSRGCLHRDLRHYCHFMSNGS